MKTFKIIPVGWEKHGALVEYKIVYYAHSSTFDVDGEFWIRTVRQMSGENVLKITRPLAMPQKETKADSL